MFVPDGIPTMHGVRGESLLLQFCNSHCFENDLFTAIGMRLRRYGRGRCEQDDDSHSMPIKAPWLKVGSIHLSISARITCGSAIWSPSGFRSRNCFSFGGDAER